LGWYTQEVVILYLAYERCSKRGYYVEEDREQGVIANRKLKEIK